MNRELFGGTAQGSDAGIVSASEPSPPGATIMDNTLLVVPHSHIRLV
jgi:hypothetical protein